MKILGGIQMRSRCISRRFLLLTIVVILCVAAGLIICNSRLEQRAVLEEKRAELAAAYGKCREDSIILVDVEEVKLGELSEKLGARYRTTKDRSFSVLYLAEGTTIYDVYKDKAYDSYIPYMYPDYIAELSETDALGNTLIAASPDFAVSDDRYEQQSYLDYIDLSDTWATTRGEGVTIAIIDTGIDTDHPEFTGRISEYSYNASEDKVVKDYGLGVIEDEYGHGTNVAGVLAAGMDGQGIVGIAPEA